MKASVSGGLIERCINRRVGGHGKAAVVRVRGFEGFSFGASSYEPQTELVT